MATAEYPDFMTPVSEVKSEEELEQFKKVHELANKIHAGGMDEIGRFQSIMSRLMSIEKDLSLIKKHFNIVHIIDNQP